MWYKILLYDCEQWLKMCYNNKPNKNWVANIKGKLFKKWSCNYLVHAWTTCMNKMNTVWLIITHVDCTCHLFFICMFYIVVCLLFVYLFVCVFSSHLRIFNSYWDVFITGEGKWLQILTYAQHLWPLSIL